MFVPVIDKNQQPLMPTSPKRARKMIESGKATPFWKKGVFCVRLNVEPSARNLQPVAVGVDPGSKREGVTVKSNQNMVSAKLRFQESLEAYSGSHQQQRRIETPWIRHLQQSWACLYWLFVSPGYGSTSGLLPL